MAFRDLLHLLSYLPPLIPSDCHFLPPFLPYFPGSEYFWEHKKVTRLLLLHPHFPSKEGDAFLRKKVSLNFLPRRRPPSRSLWEGFSATPQPLPNSGIFQLFMVFDFNLQFDMFHFICWNHIHNETNPKNFFGTTVSAASKEVIVVLASYGTGMKEAKMLNGAEIGTRNRLVRAVIQFCTSGTA